MDRRQAFAALLIVLLFSMAMACGGGSSTTTPAPSATPTVSGDQQASNPSFAVYDPALALTLIIGQTFRVRWNAVNYSASVAIRALLDDDTDTDSFLHTFPMTYTNGSNYLDWDTTTRDPGVYYFAFRIEDGGTTTYQYSKSITLVAETPYTVPPTVQLYQPLAARTVYPNTLIDVSFKVGNADPTVATTVGIDSDQLHTNGITTWLPTQYVGLGNFDMVWDTAGFPNDTYYIVVKAVNGALTTYSYSQKIRIADTIDLGAPPTVEYQLPTDAILVTAGQTISTRFSIDDTDSNCTARFMIDNDTNSDNGWVNTVYTNLGKGVATYDWSTLGVVPGVYFFLVIAEDGNNTTVKYSSPLIVNPVGQLTAPPVITVTTPNRALTVPIGAPLQIAGSVVDPDSEAIVRIGIDGDNNFANGITGWLQSTFTGAFDVTWITTFYPAGLYYIVVFADDGVNQIHKYTEIIDIQYLMAPGWTTNKIREVSDKTVVEGLDSLGVFNVVHAGAPGSPTPLYRTSNADANWATTQLTNSALVSRLKGRFDALDDIHLMFHQAFGNIQMIQHSRVNTWLQVTASPAAPQVVALDLFPSEDGNDDLLYATVDGAEVRVYHAFRVGGVINRTRIMTNTEFDGTPDSLWGRIFKDATGRTHVVFQIVKFVDIATPTVYPVFYMHGKNESWSTPVNLGDASGQGEGFVEAIFDGTKIHAVVNKKTQISYSTCNTAGVTTSNLLVVPEPGQPLHNVNYTFMKLIGSTPHIVYQYIPPGATGPIRLSHYTFNGTNWAYQPLGDTTADMTNKFWLITPAGGQYVFCASGSSWGAFRSSALGWSFEPILTTAIKWPTAAWAPNGDIVVAYRTSGVGEQRLNFSRKLNTTGAWAHTQLNNDCADDNIAIFVNKANNIYIRYWDTNSFLSVVTFR